MGRLIAFGCSNTYGEHLPDNHSLPYNTHPSKYAWPSVLAKKLGRESVNMGEGGASNKKICFNIHNFNFEEEDLVVILWTYHNRSCILHEDPERIVRLIHTDISQKHSPLPLGVPQKVTKLYYKLFENEYDSWYDQYCRVNLAKNYLDSLNIKNNSFLTSDYQQTNLKEPRWNTVYLETLDMPSLCLADRALDDLHPGIKSHEAIAAKILKYM